MLVTRLWLLVPGQMWLLVIRPWLLVLGQVVGYTDMVDWFWVRCGCWFWTGVVVGSWTERLLVLGHIVLVGPWTEGGWLLVLG